MQIRKKEIYISIAAQEIATSSPLIVIKSSLIDQLKNDGGAGVNQIKLRPLCELVEPIIRSVAELSGTRRRVKLMCSQNAPRRPIRRPVVGYSISRSWLDQRIKSFEIKFNQV